MAALVVRKFSNYEAVNMFLRGDILSGPLASAAPVVSPTVLYGLHGLTVIFTTPAVTCTFSDPTGAGLTPKQIAAALQAALTATHVVSVYKSSIRIEKATPGVIVMLGTGTANVRLGLPAATTTTVKYAAPTDAAPRLISLSGIVAGEAIVVVTEE